MPTWNRRCSRSESAGAAVPEKTAFVLAGDGRLGAVQVGMLTELLATGGWPDLIVGVSAGALNGSLLAHDCGPATVDRMARLWSRVSTRDILGLSWSTLLGVIGLRSYLAHADGLRSLLERELPTMRFEQTQLPLHIVAADQETGDEVLLSTGEILESVLASTAIPGVFPPVLLGGRTLVDGVVATGTPIATAVRLGATRLIVMPGGFACVGKAVPKHPIGRALHAITLPGASHNRRTIIPTARR